MRVTSQVYNDALRPIRLRATQFVVLLAIRLLGATTMGALAQTIVTDPTTLSRSVEPLIRRKLITRVIGTDQRRRMVTLTSAGHQILADAYPHWQAAQAIITSHMSPKDLKHLIQGLDALTQLKDRASAAPGADAASGAGS
jgi:DNA-binding MarR family transcriptional regulator